jgi:SAM-dependent methyltransferase
MSENNTARSVNRTEQNSANEGVGLEQEIYKKRFSSNEEAARNATWKVLVPKFFQRFVGRNSTVVDLGAGDGHFITNIVASTRIAVDLSPHVLELQNKGIDVHVVAATDFTKVVREPVDVIFMSNFLEHLPTKQVLLSVLEECHRALKPGGMVLILQPNIRYVGPAYWDYIDHHIALTEHSLSEALSITGYEVVELIPKFLPYTAKSMLGNLTGAKSFSWLISLYLSVPFLWKIFGKQTFVAAKAVK